MKPITVASHQAVEKPPPHIITVYDMIHERFPESFHALDNTLEIKRLAVERADLVIAISDHIRKDLLELYSLSPDKVTTVHLGFDNFEVSAAIHSDGLTLKNEEPFLLYVGNRAGYKNFNYFLKAYVASFWLRSNFSIVAFGGGNFTIGEKRLIADLQLDTMKINHLSGDDRLPGSLYRKAAAFIYPSRYEGFGIPPLEAMAHDCPVIASHVSSIPEIVGEAGSYFDQNSVENIRVVMEQTLSSQQVINELKLKGRQRLTQFSWEKCAESTLKIYQQVT